MGRPKSLLPLQGETFLTLIVGRLERAGVDELLIVLGAFHEQILRELELADRQVLVNADWRSGQLSSLRLGISCLAPESEGLLFTLVDHPLVEQATYRLLIDAWKHDKRKIIVPTYERGRGHPTILPGRLYDELLHRELPGGARDVVREENGAIRFVPVDDPGVVADIDTPADYKEWAGER